MPPTRISGGAGPAQQTFSQEEAPAPLRTAGCAAPTLSRGGCVTHDIACPRCRRLGDDHWRVFSFHTLCTGCQGDFLPTVGLIRQIEREARQTLPPSLFVVYTWSKGAPPGPRREGYESEGVGHLIRPDDPLAKGWPYLWSWTGTNSPFPDEMTTVLLWEARVRRPDSPLAMAGRYWPGLPRPLLALAGLEHPHRRGDYARLPDAMAAFEAQPFNRSNAGRKSLTEMDEHDSSWREFARASLDIVRKEPHVKRPQRAARLGVASEHTLRKWENALKEEQRKSGHSRSS